MYMLPKRGLPYVCSLHLDIKKLVAVSLSTFKCVHLVSAILCKVHVIYMVHSSLYALIWLIYVASEMYEMSCILCIKQANFIFNIPEMGKSIPCF